MGFKMKGSPIKVDGAIVKFFKGTDRESSADTQSRRRAAGNFTKAELAATKKDFTKDPNFGVSPKVLPKTSQQSFDKLMTLPNAVTQPAKPTQPDKPTQPTQTKKKVVKKKTNKGTVSTSSGFSSLTKAPKVGENMVKQSSKKIDLVSSSRPQTRKEIKATKKKDKAKSGVSRQQVRLAKTQAKAASAKAKTNQTARSIDTGKPKSADTGAKQTSARRSRAKAKRLENRASRIEGRIERKASRQAQRKKIKENR